VQLLAERLLMGEREGPPTAWLMRADLLRRTGLGERLSTYARDRSSTHSLSQAG
jgi:hypothetical protein